jgi:hypothetical protein
MNVANFIFRLLHIRNLLTLFILTPFCSPYTPFTDYAHLSIECENTSGNYIDFSPDYAHSFNDCANTCDDRANIVADSTNMLDISSLDLCIPNHALLQLLLTCR